MFNCITYEFIDDFHRVKRIRTCERELMSKLIRYVEVKKRVRAKEWVGVKMNKGMLEWFGHLERLPEERMT